MITQYGSDSAGTEEGRIGKSSVIGASDAQFVLAGLGISLHPFLSLLRIYISLHQTLLWGKGTK